MSTNVIISSVRERCSLIVSKGKSLLLAVLLLSVTMMAKANPVDAERASQVATTFLNNNWARTYGLTDVSSAVGITNLFVFTTENSFVILAADDRVQPILGYSLTGRFVTEDMPDNLRGWLQGYSDMVQDAIDRQLRATPATTQQWEALCNGNPNVGRAVTVVQPLVQTQWNQGSPYNLLCPNGSVTGCVATAMAQVMKYWNYPSHGVASHSYTPGTHPEYGVQTANFYATYYDWTNMTNTYSSSSTQAQKQAVATLVYHCGISVDMDYTPNSSGAVTAYVADALKTYFNYSSDAQFLSRADYSDAQWISMLKSDLDQGRPIQYSGRGSGGGHSFVCDGYDNNNYFHFNWGWGGYCDAYYSINNLNPGPGGIGSGSNGIYNNDQGAIFGVHPSECTASEPLNLTFTQNGRNVTLNWQAASGAASYKVYRNTNYLSDAATNTYTDNAPVGTTLYYVRSVDSNGRLSLPSNAVTVTVNYQAPVVDDLTATVTDNNVNLSWTAPEWCYPQSPTAVMSYGEGPVYYSWSNTYYGHRYLASEMAQYANKAVYKVSTYIQYAGTYTIYVYTASTSSNQPSAGSLAVTKVMNFENLGWQDFEFDNPVLISGSSDLWIVLKQENTNQTYPAPSFNLSSYNANACYYGSYSPTSLSNVSTSYPISWFIKTFITDGVYTYNIYRNGFTIASNVASTTYDDNNLNVGTYNYYVKTNYYAGVTDASNEVLVEIGLDTYYDIQASANPVEGGTVAGAGSYMEGDACTLTATASSGYTFVNWTENGTQVSTNPTYTFTVTGNRNLMANFTEVGSGYHWDVNIHTYPNNLIMVGVVLINGEEQVTDMLEVGAFCDGECRGRERLSGQYYQVFGRYFVNLTVYGEDGDEISFRLYDHATETELDLTCAPITFATNGVFGNPVNPHVFDFGLNSVTQTTDFAEGWNWWSTYIDQSGIDGLTMLEEGLGDNGVTIKSQGDGFVQFMNYGGYTFWYGTLDHLVNSQTYMVQTMAPVQMEMTGNLVSPADYPITISENWNWIGYPSNVAMDFSTAFAGVMPTDGDIVKTQNSFAQYMVYGGYGFWYGELSTGVITPGTGLMYKSANPNSYTFTYPAMGRTAVTVQETVNKHWTNDVHAYPANMTVLAVVELDDEELASEHYELAAFADGECRGSARLTYVEPLNRYMAFLTVSGDEAISLNFGLYDTETGMECHESNDILVYSTDATIGSFDEPMVISFRGTKGIDAFGHNLQMYPNPVKAGSSVNVLMDGAAEQPVQVEIMNALGCVVDRQTVAKTPASVAAPTVPGIYMIRITVEGEGITLRKLVVE